MSMSTLGTFGRCCRREEEGQYGDWRSRENSPSIYMGRLGEGRGVESRFLERQGGFWRFKESGKIFLSGE